MRSTKRLGDLLVEYNKITQDQLEEIIKLQHIRKKKIGQLLVEEGFIEEEDIIDILVMQLGIQRADFNNMYIDQGAVKSIPYLLAKKHISIPLFYDKDNNMVVAMNDPLDIIAIDNIKLVTNKEVIPVIATKNQIIDLIEKFYKSDDAERAVEEFNNSQFSSIKSQESLDQISNAPVVRLVNNIIETGVRNIASDIHIEPYENWIRVRMRIDGILQEMMKLDIRTHIAIVGRIKIMSDLNIAERRLPQDGAIVIKVDKRDIDLRISILPTIYGEKVVIRILDKTYSRKSIDQLGFNKNHLAVVKDFLNSPHGILLVTGPTGSGKSTTLYTLLNELNGVNKNIITVEDPVEYKLEGINQVQVNVKAGLTFVSGLRSILRQDPDIIMLGEIRDIETAKIAIRASITGHLVLSTIHTNDAISTVNRLVDMGIAPYLVSSSIIGVISQRLIRRLCTRCKEEYEASNSEKKLLGIPLNNHLILNKPFGCSYCNNTGYKGRIGVHEILGMNKDLREMIARNVSYDLLYEQAIKGGMVTLSENAKQLVISGVTHIKEASEIVTLTKNQKGE